MNANPTDEKAAVLSTRLRNPVQIIDEIFAICNKSLIGKKISAVSVDKMLQRLRTNL